MQIQTVTTSTFDKLLPLIAEYQHFYRAEPNEERNRAYFSQFLSDHSNGILFIALDEDSEALGFATIYFWRSSVRACVECLMNDLLTVPSARGKGIGRALIEHCRNYAKSQGYNSLVWRTEQSNHVAQRLYDSTEAKQSAWYEYALPT